MAIVLCGSVCLAALGRCRVNEAQGRCCPAILSGVCFVEETHQLIARLWVEVIFQRESWLARSHVHTKVLQFQSKFHLWLSGLSFDYSAVVFSSTTCHHRWSCSKFYNCNSMHMRGSYFVILWSADELSATVGQYLHTSVSTYTCQFALRFQHWRPSLGFQQSTCFFPILCRNSSVFYWVF